MGYLSADSYVGFSKRRKKFWIFILTNRGFFPRSLNRTRFIPFLLSLSNAPNKLIADRRNSKRMCRSWKAEKTLYTLGIWFVENLRTLVYRESTGRSYSTACLCTQKEPRCRFILSTSKRAKQTFPFLGSPENWPAVFPICWLRFMVILLNSEKR